MATAATTTSTNGHNATKRAVNKTKRFSATAARGAHRTIDGLESKVSHFAEDAGHTMHDLYNNGLHRAEETAEHAREMVQERPLSALAAAFFGGVVLATLLRR